MTTVVRSRVATRRLLIILTVFALIAAALMVAFVRGYLPRGSATTHPPCNQLPSAATVDTALTDHSALVTAIKATGPRVSVRRATPCEDDKDRALVEITYETDPEREAITTVLNTRNGFGVPVYVHD